MHVTGRNVDGIKKGSLRVYDVAPPVLLLFLTVVFFWRQLILGNALYWGDIGLYFLPMQRFLHTQLHRGLLPLWNPYILCGAPYVGNPQTWVLYPSSLFLFPMSPEHAINAMVALHVWLAGCGMYFFLRQTTGLRKIPCLFAAVVFMFGGQLVSKEQFPNMLQAMAYTPWILLATDKFVHRRNLCTSTALGTILGLQVLSAHAQITMLALYLATAYGLLVLARIAWAFYRRGDISPVEARRRMRVEAGRLALSLAGAGVIAAGLAACQVLPTVELFVHAWRQRLTFKIVNRFYLPPNQLLNFTLPTLHGHPYFGNFTARGNFWETCCYVGWLPVVLAILAGWFGFVRKRSGRGNPRSEHPGSHDAVAKVRFWSIVFVIGVWMSTGGVGKLYRGAWAVLPGFRNFHDPARCLLWASTALAILAAYGLHAVMRRLATRSREYHDVARKPGQSSWRILPSAMWREPAVVASLIVFITFADLCRFGATIYPLAPPAQIDVTLPNGALARVRADHAIAIGQARVIGPDSARVWERFATHRSYRQSVPDFNALWRDTLTPNLSMDAGIMNAYGYEPETRLDTQRILGMIDADYGMNATDRQRQVAATLSGIYGVRYVATERVNPPETEIARLKTVFDEPALPLLHAPNQIPGHVYLSRDLSWQPRARLTTNFAPVASQWDAVRAFEAYNNGDIGIDIPHTTLVAGDIVGVIPSTGQELEHPADAPSTSTPGAASPSSVDIADPSPDRVDVTAVTNRPCLLVLADTYHPGWQATVDGRPEQIHSADGFVRAIALPDPGRHVVSFRYRPATFYVGLYISLLTLCAVIAIGTAICARARGCSAAGRKWTGSRRTDLSDGFSISR